MNFFARLPIRLHPSDHPAITPKFSIEIFRKLKDGVALVKIWRSANNYYYDNENCPDIKKISPLCIHLSAEKFLNIFHHFHEPVHFGLGVVKIKTRAGITAR